MMLMRMGVGVEGCFVNDFFVLIVFLGEEGV